MLVRFRFRNVRSFRDEFEFSLVASTLSETGVARRVPWRTGDSDRSFIEVLPAAAVFGANASGKSNVLRAMADMRSCVLRSFRSWGPSGTVRRRFRLGGSAENEVTLFEVDLILDGVLHRYGFTLDDEVIQQEWAYRFPRGREQVMFERDGSNIKIGTSMPAGLGAAVELVRDNALFMSTAVALRGTELGPLYDWFERNLRFAEAGSRSERQAFTVAQLKAGPRRAQILTLLSAADLGVNSATVVEPGPEVEDKIERMKQIFLEGEDAETDEATAVVQGNIRLSHRGITHDVDLDMAEESLGTLVWLGLIGPIVDVLDQGSVLLADELDASLHPHLVAEVVRLFQSAETNPRRAQILFNSHDASLLGDSASGRLLGRDQVWFAEKDGNGASRLYPLSDLDPRKNEAVGRRYLSGRYGAVPILAEGDFAGAIPALTSASTE